MRYLIILILVLISLVLVRNVSAATESPQAAKNGISALQPALSDKEVARLQQAVFKVSRRKDCKISWALLLTVAYVESSFHKKAIGKNADSLDLGLMQINQRTAKLYGFNERRLLQDEEYNLSAGCRVLSDLRDDYAHTIPHWVGLYRTGTAINKPNIVKAAKAYHRKVLKNLEKVLAYCSFEEVASGY